MGESDSVATCLLLSSDSPLRKGRASTPSSPQTYSFQKGKDREDELYPWCAEGRRLSSTRRAGKVCQVLFKIQYLKIYHHL